MILHSIIGTLSAPAMRFICSIGEAHIPEIQLSQNGSRTDAFRIDLTPTDFFLGDESSK